MFANGHQVGLSPEHCHHIRQYRPCPGLVPQPCPCMLVMGGTGWKQPPQQTLRLPEMSRSLAWPAARQRTPDPAVARPKPPWYFGASPPARSLPIPWLVCSQEPQPGGPWWLRKLSHLLGQAAEGPGHEAALLPASLQPAIPPHGFSSTPVSSPPPLCSPTPGPVATYPPWYALHPSTPPLRTPQTA